MPGRAVVVVVPCYNEAERLDQAAFLRYVHDVRDVSLLFVNDGSRDRTSEVLRELAARDPAGMAVLDRKANVGKAEAVRAGLLEALRSPDAAYAGFWDADLATPLEVIGDFVAMLDQRPDIDMVIGSRVKLLGRQIERQAVRHYLGRVFATFASLSLDLPVYDTQCGAKLFRVTPALRQVLAEPFLSRWIFDVELIARFLTLDRGFAHRIYEFPLLAWRDVPGSKIKPRDFVRATAELWAIYQRYPPRRA